LQANLTSRNINKHNHHYMKKARWLVGSLIALGLLGQTGTALAAPYPPALGGTGTATVPSAGMVLIGNSGGTYTPAYLQCSSGCSVATSSGGVAITVPTTPGTSLFAGPYILITASGTNGYTVQNIGVLSLASSADIGVSNATGTGITFSFLNPKGYATTTIQSVLNSLSAIGLATYNSSTGQFSVSSSSLNLKSASQYNFSDFLPSSTVYVANANGNWAGTWQNTNTTDFLASSTAFVSSFNTRTGAVTLTSADVTTALGFTPLSKAITTINGASSTSQTFSAGTGLNVTTVAGASNSTTTFTNTGVTSFNGATGTITYAPSTTIPTNNNQLTNGSGYITTSTNNFGGLTNASVTALSPIVWSSTSTISCPTCITTSTSSGVATGTVVSLGSPLIVGGAVTSTIYGDGSSTYISDFNTKYQIPASSSLAANGCPGNSSITDVTLCLHYLYTNAPGSVEIDLAGTSYPSAASTSFNIANKYILIKGVAGGATAINSSFSTTGQCAWTFDIGNAKQTGWGMDGIYLNGPNSGQSLGTCWGGSQGAEGGGLHDSLVTHFYHNIKVLDNTYLWFMDHSVSNFNVSGGDLLWINGSSNTGETIVVGGVSLLADAQPAANGVHIQTSGETNVVFDGCSLDDAQAFIDQYGGQGNYVAFSNCNVENPAAWNGSIPYYDYFTMNSGNPYMNDTLVLDKDKIQSDAGTYVMNQIVGNLNGHLVFTNNEVANDGQNGFGAWTAVASFATTSSTIYSAGNTQASDLYDGVGAKYLYNTKPFGGGVQTYNVTSTFDGPTVFYVTPTDANGNPFATSSASLATTTPFSAGYVPFASSSNAVTNSNIYELPNATTTILTATSTITLDNTSGGSYNGGATSTLTAAYTVGTSTNRMLFIGVLGQISVSNITGVTYAGVPMTLIGRNLNAGDRYEYLFALANPATGTNNYVVTASDNNLIATVVESFFGVKQSVVMDATSSANVTSGTSLTTSLTTNTDNDWSILIGRTAVNTAVAGASSTLRQSNGTFQTYDTNGAKTPPGTQAMTFTASSDNFASIMAAFSPAPAVTTSTLNPYIGVGTQTPSTRLDVNGDITDENVTSSPFVGTNSTGTLIKVTTSTLKSYTDTFGYVTSTGTSFSTTTAYTFGATQTFNSSTNFNATATFNSSTIFTANTSTILVTNASGSVANYTATSCAAGSAFTGLSASGTPSCTSYAPSTTIPTTYVTSVNGATGTYKINVTGPLTIATDTQSSTLSCPTCDTAAIPSGANPSATISTSTQNGSASTFMRSDAAPVLSQSLGYTFSALGNTTSTGNISAATLNVSTTAQLGSTTVTGTLGATGLVSSTSGFAQGANVGVSTTCAQALAYVSSTHSGGIATAGTCDTYSTFWQPFQGYNSNLNSTSSVTNSTRLWGPVQIEHPTQANALLLFTTTADASTTDKYDMGLYFMPAINATTATKIISTGAIALNATAGTLNVSSTQGTTVLQPGIYLIGLTGNSTTAKFAISNSFWFAGWISAVGTVSAGGVLPATTTVPAATWTIPYTGAGGGAPNIGLHL